MAELNTTTLPLYPLSGGVVLPGMVVTMQVDDEEARVAVAAAEAGDGRLLLLPRIESRYADVGTIAKIENSADLPNGVRGLILRGLERAKVAGAAVGTGKALQVQVEPIPAGRSTERARVLAKEYRAVVETIFENRGVPRLSEALREITDPGAMADTAGYAPELTVEQKIEVLETIDVEARIEKVLGWMRDVLADLTIKQRIQNDVNDGMEKTQREFLLRQQLAAIRKELGEGTDGESVVEEYRTKIAESAMPDKVPRDRRARARPLRAHQRAEPRARVDPHLAGHRHRGAVGQAVRRQPRRHRGPSDPRRRPHRARRREEPDRRVPGRPQAAGRPWPAGLGGQGFGRHHRPRRSSRRGQDLARRVGGPRPGPRVRAGVAGRRPRRGRDPWPPAHLRRRHARPHRPRA